MNDIWVEYDNYLLFVHVQMRWFYFFFVHLECLILFRCNFVSDIICLSEFDKHKLQ